MRDKIAFGWYGGKYSHLSWLLPLLPVTKHYVEPFAGSAAVLLNRKPSDLETYNDLDEDVVNFFTVLRDQPGELIRQLSLTPISRAEFAKAIIRENNLTALEKARRFYIRARQTRMGLAQTAHISQWANCITTSSRGMADVVSRWHTGCDELEALAARLISVQIEARPALDVVRIYDTSQTLFYCDPPYLPETRKSRSNYKHEMTKKDHRTFLKQANELKALVAISGYESDLYNKMLPSTRWMKHEAPLKLSRASTVSKRAEILWTNYDPKDFAQQMSLF